MDNTQELEQEVESLKQKVKELTRKVEEFSNPATISDEFLKTLTDKGFLRKSLYLTYEGSSGMLFTTVFIDYESKTTALTGFDKSYYKNFTASTSDTCTSISHGLTNDTPVYVVSTGVVPGGLDPTVQYYIINSATDTFKLSTTVGGAAVNITSIGTGSHYLLPQ
jgi:hypothetical protein